MRVALQIDGDAKGAEQAAQDTSRAITDLGKQTDAISQAIEAGFKGAVSSLEGLKNASQGAGAANDNNANSALGLAGKLSQVATQATGADSALSKGATGAVNFAKGIGDAVRAVGTFNVIGAVLSLAITAASTFYGVINSGGTEAAKRLDEQSRLIGVVRDAYKDAAKSAGEFYTQSKNITLLQAQQNLIGLQADLAKKAPTFAAGATGSTYAAPAAFGGEASIGFDLENATKNISPFQKALDDLHTSIAQGAPAFAAYREEIAKIGIAAQGTNPQLAAQAAELLKNSQEVGDLANAVKKTEALIAVLNNTASDEQKKMVGVATATAQTANEFERLTKSMSRQAAAQEAEAQAAGKSVGEIARLRAEFILTEAAQQSGAGTAAKYADQIKAIAARFGEASQNAALFKLQSSTAFDLGQLGRGSVDATVADRLRGVFGDNVDGQLNSATAGAIRFNEQMRELKITTQDVATGAFRDLRTEIAAGTGVWEAFGKAGVNALNKIIDKLADKAFDTIISGAFGSALGIGGTGTVANGGIVLGGPNGPGTFAAAAGGTFGPGWGVVGEEGPEIMQVHNGGVTVYPHQVSRPYLPGFAEGGSLSPWGNVSRFPKGGQDNNQAAGAPQGLKVSVGVTVDDDGKLQAYVKNVSAQTTSDGLSGYIASPDFITHVANASNTAKAYGMA
jgi:hypothetical protein